MKKTIIVVLTTLVLVSSCTKDSSTQEKVNLDPNAKKVFIPENGAPPPLTPSSQGIMVQEGSSTGMVSSGAEVPPVRIEETIIPNSNETQTNKAPEVPAEVVTLSQSGIAASENRTEEVPTAPAGTLQMNGLPASEGN